MAERVTFADLLRKAEEKKKNNDKPNPVTPGMDKSGQDKISVDKYSKDKISVDKSKQDRLSTLSQDKIWQEQAFRVETSPTKNFTKTSNSIVKLAIPEKYFRGQSKHTYDVLYQRTRGAIVPVRQIQLSKTELVRFTGLNEKTVQYHLRYLRDSRLIAVHPQKGSRSGWVYEVFIPEELETLVEYGQDKISVDKYSKDKTMQNLSSQTMQNLSLPYHTNTVENKGVNDVPKTLFKTNTIIDDEKAAVFSGMIAKLDAASKKITGKGVSINESEKWKDFADLLVLELEIAARKTKVVSSVPAFLTEILRRQFFASGKKRELFTKPELKAKSDMVGKSDTGTYEIKPLTKDGKEEAFNQLKEFAQEDFLGDFEKWYTPEDWKWLNDKLSEK